MVQFGLEKRKGRVAKLGVVDAAAVRNRIFFQQPPRNSFSLAEQSFRSPRAVLCRRLLCLLLVFGPLNTVKNCTQFQSNGVEPITTLFVRFKLCTPRQSNISKPPNDH